MQGNGHAVATELKRETPEALMSMTRAGDNIKQLPVPKVNDCI